MRYKTVINSYSKAANKSTKVNNNFICCTIIIYCNIYGQFIVELLIQNKNWIKQSLKPKYLVSYCLHIRCLWSRITHKLSGTFLNCRAKTLLYYKKLINENYNFFTEKKFTKPSLIQRLESMWNYWCSVSSENTEGIKLSNQKHELL